MYRPDRIGPYMLGNSESGTVPIVPADITNNTSLMTGGVVTGRAYKAAGNIAHDGQTLVPSGGMNIPSLEGVALGLKISGQELYDSDQYLVGCSMSCAYNADDVGLSVVPVLGRVIANGTQDLSLKAAILVPAAQHNAGFDAAGPDNFAAYTSCNTEIVIGDWTPVADFTGEELFFGAWIRNGSTAVAGITSMWLSLSLHRYEGDLKPFDPNR